MSWHKVHVTRKAEGGLSVSVCQTLHMPRGKDNLIATPNSILCLKNPKTNKFIFIRPSFTLSHDSDNQGSGCFADPEQVVEFLPGTQGLRMGLCNFDHPANFITLTREVDAICDAENTVGFSSTLKPSGPGGGPVSILQEEKKKEFSLISRILLDPSEQKAGVGYLDTNVVNPLNQKPTSGNLSFLQWAAEQRMEILRQANLNDSQLQIVLEGNQRTEFVALIVVFLK